MLKEKRERETKMMRKGKSPSSSPRFDCDVGLGLKMQPADSYYFDGGGHNFYGVADSLFLHNTPSRGGMGVCGKALFTASQWQELERQKMIHKYILASIPVPPQLLLPTSSRSSPPSSLSQYNSILSLFPSLPPSLSPQEMIFFVYVASSGLDLRFSSGGSDPEPWRCKRTDGKKWRCSRDVAPDLKYCERHAHKSKPRSRKLVEVSSHKPLIPPANAALQPPSLAPADQTRCIEWFMKGGSSTHVMHLSSSSLSSRMELNRDDDFMSLNPYIPDTSNLHGDPNPVFDPKMKTLTQTRHFIDAWEKEGGYQGMRRSKGQPASLSSKFPISPSSSSLSLSMCGGDYDSSKGDLGIGMMSSERENEGVLKPQWMNPGGPLGEALCLGNASSNLDYGYSSNTNTNTTNTNTNSSICSKSYCEDGSYALNFIGDS